MHGLQALELPRSGSKRAREQPPPCGSAAEAVDVRAPQDQSSPAAERKGSRALGGCSAVVGSSGASRSRGTGTPLGSTNSSGASPEQAQRPGCVGKHGGSRMVNPVMHAESGRMSSQVPEVMHGPGRGAALAPYKQDGFAREELPEVSRWAVCRTDERWLARRHSRTVSFRRTGQASAT